LLSGIIKFFTTLFTTKFGKFLLFSLEEDKSHSIINTNFSTQLAILSFLERQIKNFKKDKEKKMQNIKILC